MSGESGRNDSLEELFDGYVGGLLDAEGMVWLEEILRGDPEARAAFVRYCRMETDLHLLERAQRAADRALESLGSPREGPAARPSPRRRRAVLVAAAAACLLCAVAATWHFTRSAEGSRAAAWLVNAQNCRWQASGLRGDLVPGRRIKLAAGLAELRFACGATVLLQGPADLTILSSQSARLDRGRISARVPEEARGFQVVSPGGRVVDLGTEFGLAVGEDGATEVRVFSGHVEAFGTMEAGPSVDLTASERARIAGGAVSVGPVAEADGGGGFVRSIGPPPAIVPRTLLLDFRRAVDETIRDVSGLGTGLTSRLPGTGANLPARDGNLRLDPAAGRLRITTTRSDINTQYLLGDGEYLGIRLAELGFTGNEDFEITMVVPEIPGLQAIGQFGLYAGSRSDRVIRGGLISREEPESYSQFLVNNNGGRDADLNVVGLLSSGDTLRLTLARKDNRYCLTVENLSTGGTSTLTIRHPDSLDREKDLHVGLFAANTGGEVRKTLAIREMYVTVRTKVAAQE